MALSSRGQRRRHTGAKTSARSATESMAEEEASLEQLEGEGEGEEDAVRYAAVLLLSWLPTMPPMPTMFQ